jgi:hypothetical protein
MYIRPKRIVIGSAIFLLAAGVAAAATGANTRPVMPSINVTVSDPAKNNMQPTLMLVYWDNGSPPFSVSNLPTGWRLSSCETMNGQCVSEPARRELHLRRTQEQSVQVRLFDGRTNPVIGGVSWSGPSYPDEVSITCDLNVMDIAEACAFVGQADTRT